MVNVACPLAFRVPVPRVVDPSMKVAVPVGVPTPVVTVAVKVTDWPKVDGLGEEVRDVMEVAWFMVCMSTDEVEVLKLKSPP